MRISNSVILTSVIQRILTIIDSIGFSKTGYNPQFSDIETKIVYDADKLDAIGAFGIARAFASWWCKSRPLFIADRLPPQNLDLKTCPTLQTPNLAITIP